MTITGFGTVTEAFLEQLCQVQDVFRSHGCGEIYYSIAPETLKYCISTRQFTPDQVYAWCCNRPVQG